MNANGVSVIFSIPALLPDEKEHGGGRGRHEAPGVSDLAVILSASQEDHGSVAGKAPGGREHPRLMTGEFSIHSEAPPRWKNLGREGDAADSGRTGPRGMRSLHTNATLFAAPAVSWLANAHLFFFLGGGDRKSDSERGIQRFS